jgi:predicted MPP superfamily phosphohydrolase
VVFSAFLVCLLIIAIYSWYVEPNLLRIHYQSITTHHLKKRQESVRILFLSDLHVGFFTRSLFFRNKLRRLLRLHKVDPFDAVFLGGDLIDHNPKYLALLESFFPQLTAFEVPIIAVLGNHDYRAFHEDVAPLTEMLRRHGVKVLRNQSTLVHLKGRDILVVGIDDLHESEIYGAAQHFVPAAESRRRSGTIDWYQKFDTDHTDLLRIVMSHNPDAVYLPGIDPDLILAGHTHGGQMFILDWLAPHFQRLLAPFLPGGSFVTRAGRFQIGKRTLVISRGIECSTLPLRLLRVPEAMIIDIVPKPVN